VPVLHVVTDDELLARPGFADVATALAADGGARLAIHVRGPHTDGGALHRLPGALVEPVRACGALLVVNDRVDVALAAGVDAVHLGRDDLPAGLARQLLGPDALLGATANSLEEARRADGLPVDYLGVGPVYGTRSKENPAPELGLDGLRAIVAGVRKPVLAIGNITAERVAEVLDAGAAGVAVLSAVTRDPDPERATMRIRKAIDAWRRERKG
jgi:thiamine-phosphate pyrophosphorylase